MARERVTLTGHVLYSDSGQESSWMVKADANYQKRAGDTVITEYVVGVSFSENFNGMQTIVPVEDKLYQVETERDNEYLSIQAIYEGLLLLKE